MRTGMMALAAGMLLLVCLPLLPSYPVLLAMSLAASGLLLRRFYALGLFVLGLCWACLSAHWALDDRLAPELEGRTLWLQGQVSGLPSHVDGVQRFELTAISARRADLPSRIRVSWYGGPDVASGERWRLAVNLRAPQGGVNPQTFEYEAWLLAQRIGATGTVKAGERLAPATGVGMWRDQLRQRILAVPALGREGAVAALVMGDGSGLSPLDWRVLQDTGTIHLMVISGQHISLLALLLYGAVAGLARLGYWPAAWPWLPVASVVSLLGALGYGFLAGFEVPVQRACLMVALVLLWRWRFRHLGFFTPVLFALVCVLLIEPLVVLQPGFWLSFIAVFWLIWLFAARLGRWSWAHVWWRAQWGMFIGLLLPLTVLGLPVSLSAPVANLLAVPWVSFVSVPLALLGSLLLPIPVLGEGLLWLAGASLQGLFVLLAQIAILIPAWVPAQPPVWAWLLGLVGAMLLLLPAGIPWRGLGAALLMPVIFAPVSRPEPGYAEVWVLDVGQGLSVLVRTQNHALLYDAGPKMGAFDSGERVVVPSIKRLGVSALDTLLISHADQDHAGGAVAVASAMPVKRVLSGQAAAVDRSLGAVDCQHQAHWQWDQVRFRTWQWAHAQTDNQASCVLMIEAKGERLLLTGDIDQVAERWLITQTFDLQADWLLAAHHGSRSSSSWDFLQAVAPKAALISRGRYNAFQHPHPQVLARLQRLNIAAYDTAELGALKVHLGKRADVLGMRSQTRFWR